MTVCSRLCVNDVAQSVNRLKSGKSDESGLYSDHVRNGPHKLFVELLTCLFNVMLVHGSCPENMLKGTMVPIPKCKRAGMSSSVNYRAISILHWVCNL